MKDQIVLTQYKLDDQPVSFRFAIVADLHERDASEIIFRLEEERPDVIFVVGDMFERQAQGADPRAKEKRTCLQKIAYVLASKLDDLAERFASDKSERSPENTYAFIREAVQIAPVYMSIGNHEWYFNEKDYRVLKKYGVTLLDNDDTEIWIEGKRILVGGLSSGYDMNWLKAFASKDGFKILLCHHPEYYEKIIKSTGRFDLMLSGHAHGGQWRIGNRGVFAPGQGLFPKYSHGIYEIQGGRMIVSAGCANTASVPRLGNPCEVVVVHLAACCCERSE